MTDTLLEQIKPQKQRVIHDPQNGKFGDCYRTAVAVVLGFDAEDVPHVCEKGWDNHDDLDGIDAMRSFLRPLGLTISKSVYNGELAWSAFQEWMAKFNPSVPLIVTGMGLRGVNHCVVMVGGDVVCDPHTGDVNHDPFSGAAEAEGEAYWWVEVITPSVEALAAFRAAQEKNDG